MAVSDAIREHGLIDRPTEDVDIFNTPKASATFKPTIDNVIPTLRERGYQVDVERQSNHFTRLSVRDSDDSYLTELDMSIDYRSLPATRLSVDPVLSLRDAVVNKTAALFSRSKTRDFLDFDSTCCKSPFSDKELIEPIAKTDLVFDLHYFVQILDGVSSIIRNKWNLMATALPTLKEFRLVYQLLRIRPATAWFLIVINRIQPKQIRTHGRTE